MTDTTKVTGCTLFCELPHEIVKLMTVGGEVYAATTGGAYKIFEDGTWGKTCIATT